jgi:hypothetical protein
MSEDLSIQSPVFTRKHCVDSADEEKGTKFSRSRHPWQNSRSFLTGGRFRGKKGNSPMSAKKPLPKRSPIPRNRQSRRRRDSIVPPGFTPEHYMDPKGVRRCGWRCGAIVQDPVTGEWRRCTKVVPKGGCDHHRENGRHDFGIPRDRDPGFPAAFQERQQQAHLQRGFSRIHDAMKPDLQFWPYCQGGTLKTHSNKRRNF